MATMIGREFVAAVGRRGRVDIGKPRTFARELVALQPEDRPHGSDIGEFDDVTGIKLLAEQGRVLERVFGRGSDRYLTGPL
jgi:hypothetical protein